MYRVMMTLLLLLPTLVQAKTWTLNYIDGDLQNIEWHEELQIKKYFGPDFFDTIDLLAQESKHFKIKITVDDNEWFAAEKKEEAAADPECEIEVEKSDKNQGEGKADGKVVGGSVSGEKSGTTKITIKGPCREVKDLLKALQVGGIP